MILSADEMHQQQRRPAGIVVLTFFFVFGALASGLTALMLLLPGTPLAVLWRMNPHAREGLIPIGHWGILLMATVCLACASAAFGLWHGRPWGYWTAIFILSINLLGDTLNTIFHHDWRTLIGLPIAGLMIVYLWRETKTG